MKSTFFSKSVFMKLALVLFFSIILSTSGFNQNYNPDDDFVFKSDEVASVYLTMNAADKKTLTDNVDVFSETYLHTQFRFVNSYMDTTLLIDCGVRLRGNTSRDKPKKSFKIDFKEFGGMKFFGNKKFNLKADTNDPSMIREYFALKLFREMNVPAARAHFVKLYINNEYMGLYLNVEQIDDEFTDSRFNDDTGNLYKCQWGSSLTLDNNVYNNGVFELETNEEVNDRSRLQNLIQVLNNTPSASLKTELEKILNVDLVIRYLAIEVMLGHWDGYAYNKNNFYLYENMTTGKIEFIPYDLDNTFGIDWVGRDWAVRPVLDWQIHSEARPLMTRLLAIPEYKAKYIEYITQFIQLFFNESALFPQIDATFALIKPSIMSDTYYPMSFGYTYNDFLNSLENKVANHAPYGVKPYIRLRVSSAKKELGINTGVNTRKSSYFIYPNPSNGDFIAIKTKENHFSDDKPEIRSISGSVVPAESLYNGQNEWRFSFSNKLVPGFYVVRIGDISYSFIVK